MNFDIKGVDQSKKDKVIGEIIGGKSIGQTFTSNQPNLCRIDLFFATYNRTNTKDLIFHLKSSPKSENDLATLTLRANSVTDNKYCTFRFEPISESKDVKYYFYVESPDSVNGDALTIWYSTEDAYQNNSVYINHKPIVGDLCFKIYYKFTLIDMIPYFIQRLSHDMLFLFFYSFLLIATLLGILALQIKELSRKAPEPKRF